MLDVWKWEALSDSAMERLYQAKETEDEKKSWKGISTLKTFMNWSSDYQYSSPFDFSLPYGSKH